jgi:flagellar motility protein MotE (MotC chaperone)
MVFRRIRILPLLIIVAFMAMSLRVGEIVQHSYSPGDAAAEATEQSSPSARPSDRDSQSVKINMAQLETGAGNTSDENGADKQNKQKNKNKPGRQVNKSDDVNASTSPVGEIDMEGSKKKKWPDASDTAVNYSDKRMKLYKDLAKRRKEIKKQAEKLKKKKALLKAAEQELDKKYQELKKLRNQIKSLLNEQSKQKEERISSLVKIYSGMKADDAARIFNTLEMNVLVEVMSRMSERNLAPILAEMNAEKARKVTMLLAEEKDLPSMPEKLNN